MARIRFRPSPDEDVFPPCPRVPPTLPDHLHLPRPADRQVSPRGAVAALEAARASRKPFAAFAGLPRAARARIAESPEGWAWIAAILEDASGADASPCAAREDCASTERSALKGKAEPGVLWAERALQAQVGHAPEKAVGWARYDAFLGRTDQALKRAAVRALSRPARSVSALPDDPCACATGTTGAATDEADCCGPQTGACESLDALGTTDCRVEGQRQPKASEGKILEARAAADLAPLPPPWNGVTVIVPVHGGARSLSACLAALAQTEGRLRWRALLLDDASPHAEVREVLAQHAGAPWAHLRHLPRNLGYIGAVEAGLALATQGDVVLLNSDCVVPGGDWLDRLAAHAGPETGTVTPFASDGQSFGFPLPFRPAPAFVGDRLRRIDAAAQRANAGHSVRMLTSVGFCTYVTRTCLEATGGLVADGLEAGYGEEVEFCLRASLAGLTHVAATDCVVTHLGSASFGPAKRALVRCNESVLARRFPTYFARLAAQAAADPLRAARARIERALMATDGRKGGVALLGRDAEALLATRTAWSALQRGEPLRLLEIDAPSAPEATARMTSPGLLYPQNLAYRLPGERDQLAMDLAALGRPRLFVEPALLARAVEWLGTDNFSPLDADPPLSPPLPPEVRAGLDGETYAGLFI